MGQRQARLLRRVDLLCNPLACGLRTGAWGERGSSEMCIGSRYIDTLVSSISRISRGKKYGWVADFFVRDVEELQVLRGGYK